jgi:4-aminobutyrate aminotransferase/(S)-3-amino-2-methylpropionate transaminase
MPSLHPPEGPPPPHGFTPRAGASHITKNLDCALFRGYTIRSQAENLGNVAAELMAKWEDSAIVGQVRGNGLLLGVSFKSPNPDEENWWYARAVRSRMLENGVWALSDREETIRMYPALNMDESVLREGLAVMQEAIDHVEKHGHEVGESPAWPTGVAGF